MNPRTTPEYVPKLLSVDDFWTLDEKMPLSKVRDVVGEKRVGERQWGHGLEKALFGTVQNAIARELRQVAMASPRIDTEVAASREHLELLVSDKYELTQPIPIHVYRYDDGTVLIRSMELNLYAQGFSDPDARFEFSRVLIDELEELESDVREGQPLGKALQRELAMLRRLIRGSED
jgi:hypothetical protein